MTAGGQGQANGPGQAAGTPERVGDLRIGVVLEAFLDWPFEQILSWLPVAAPEITQLEIGAGGYAPHPHCDVAGLLASGQARSAWRTALAPHGLRGDAVNPRGTPLPPGQDLAPRPGPGLVV